MELNVNIKDHSYDIILSRGALNNINSYLDLGRKVLIITDSGVPKSYAETVCQSAKDGYIYTVEMGEGSKSLNVYGEILKYMVEKSFTRSDCVVAVGGGVCGDLAGFVAASYMRGVDFYNIPTTLLSQLDSSIGGKVAVNLEGVKNIVGAFYQPKRVVIDPNTLKTLDKRQLMAGLCEGIKMAATMNKELFELIEASTDLDSDLDTIILESLKLKKAVVEQDPTEKGVRKVLNFGHTIGHAIESHESLGGLLHGECVGLGMLPLSSVEVRARLKSVLEKYSLPTRIDTSAPDLIDYIRRDKKAKGNIVTLVYVNELGTYEFVNKSIDEIEKIVSEGIL
ncbi:MAG: 3-dehydroquinate synthase [Clostridia bacterium]|nr:3-dehydroquinate synthase [Clostridia bacterium]